MIWEVVKLSDIATSQYGFTASATENEAGPKYLRITDIVPNSIDWKKVPFCAIDENKKKKYELSVGDIVVARTGPVGYAKLIRDKIDSVFASYLVRFKIFDNRALPAYVGRLLESNIYKSYVDGIKGGVAQPNANAVILGSFKFKLPPVDYQERVASILSAYDDLIENNRRRITLLERSAQLLYREWFVHFRFPGHETATFVDRLPDGWKLFSFEDVCQTIGGGTPSTKVSAYWDNGDVTWVTPTDITRNNCLALLNSEKKITRDGLKKSSAKLVPPHTILMTSRASVGFFGLVDREVCTNQGFINIIPKHEILRYYILFNLLNRVEEIRSHASGSTYAEISKSKFRSLNVIKPDEKILRVFQEKTKIIIDQVRFLKKNINQLTKARDLLLPRLMDGRISVDR